MKRIFILAFCAVCCLTAAVLPRPALATPVWEKSTYEDSDYTEVANRLNKGVTIEYSQSSAHYTTTDATDGDISTYTSKGYGVVNGDTFVFVLTNDERQAVTLTDVRLWAKWGDKNRVTFRTLNLQAKYYGSDSFVDIPNTAVDYNGDGTGDTPRQRALLSDTSGVIANAVTELKLTFERLGYYNGSGFAEIEVAGIACEISHDPIGTVMLEVQPESANVIATLSTPGPQSANADFYFACAKDGDALPTPQLVKEGMVANEIYTNVVANLTDFTNYNYTCYFTNDVGGCCASSGSFSTPSVHQWVSVIPKYDGPSWAMPTNALMGLFNGKSYGFVNGNTWTGSDYEHLYFKNSTCEWSFAEAKDLASIEIYLGNQARFIINGIDVRYKDDETYHMLTGSYIDDYYPLQANVSIASFSRKDGSYIAENVTGLRVRIGDVVESYRAFAEICPIGRDHAQNCHYDFGFCSNDTYAVATNWMKAAKLESGEAAPICLFDKDITTSSLDENWAGGTLVWNFPKPRDIQALRLITSPDRTKSYQGYKLTEFYIKRQGDADYSLVAGSKLNEFRCFQSKTNVATLRNYDQTANLADDVVACKITLEPVAGETKINLAEIELCGEQPPAGIKFIVR